MSYSYYRNFRTRETAKAEIERVPESSLPETVKALLVESVASLPADNDGSFIMIEANGHEDHNIKVRRCSF